MDFATLLVSYDLCVLLVLVADFLLITRRTRWVIVKGPVVGIAVVLGIHGWLVETDAAQFAAVGLLVMLTALFGYYNFLAFVKRGVTFAILHNRTRPIDERHPDSDFIGIDQRVAAMRGQNWIEGDNLSGYVLTAKGVFILRVRQLLFRVLRIRAIG